jgi:hypothetical protein
MINAYIKGSGNGGSNTETKTTERYGTGLKVYNYKGQLKNSKTAVFLNPDNGADMNINGEFGGTPDGIHNGIDSVLWTASAISGTWVFDSTAQAHTGTKSIDATGTNNSAVALMTRGSNIDLTGYKAITGWIYITAWSTSGTAKDVELQFRINGVNASDLIGISNYIDTTSFNTWQKFSIPLTEFNLTDSTINEMIIDTRDIGAGAPPDYYLDDMQLEETSSGAVYTVEPQSEEIWDFENITFTMVRAYDNTLANASTPKIPYDGFLGLSTLTNGINIRMIRSNEIYFSLTVKDLIDLLGSPAPTTLLSGGDGTNTWLKLQFIFQKPTTLKGATNDRIEITIQDDLTSFIRFRVGSNVNVYDNEGQ